MNTPVTGGAAAPARLLLSESEAEPLASGYLALLRLPGAAPAFVSATAARLGYGALGLPLLLTLRQGAGGYALAGAGAALFGLVSAVLGPLRARLAVRRRAMLPLFAWAYALLLTGLAAACLRPGGLPAPALLALAAVTGACAPPVGPLMRAAWGELTRRQPDARQRALSLDTACESAAFAGGPALAGLLIARCGAPVMLLAVAALLLVAFSCLAATLPGASPETRPAVPRAATAGERGARRRGVSPELLRFLVLAAASAAGLGLAELAVVAAWGAATAGVLTALFSLGGVTGGLLYGSRPWPGTLPGRALLLAVAAATCYLVPALAGSPWVAGVALLLAGACADVLLVLAYEQVEAAGHGALEDRVVAGAWVNTCYNLGAALGPALGGVLVERAGPAWGFAAATALLLLAVLARLVRRTR